MNRAETSLGMNPALFYLSKDHFKLSTDKWETPWLWKHNQFCQQAFFARSGNLTLQRFNFRSTAIIISNKCVRSSCCPATPFVFPLYLCIEHFNLAFLATEILFILNTVHFFIIWPVRPRTQFPCKIIGEKFPYEGRTRRSDRAGKTRTALLEMRTALIETATAKSMRG